MNFQTLTTLIARGAATLAAVFCMLAATAPPAAAQGASASARSQKGAVLYSCPMHPSVKSKTPGKCPKCGMDLRAAPADDSDAGSPPEDGAGESASKEDSGVRASRVSIPDLTLLDQDGREIHFYSDLVKGNVVAVQFIFTTCTTICPPMGATFARVQKELAGRGVRLISVSVDPATDTPERLKAWGEKFHAAEGWTFVTGPASQVNELLRALGASAARREDHSPTVLIGNDAKGQWTRAYGLASPSRLVKIIEDAIEGRLESPTKESGQQ